MGWDLSSFAPQAETSCPEVTDAIVAEAPEQQRSSRADLDGTWMDPSSARRRSQGPSLSVQLEPTGITTTFGSTADRSGPAITTSPGRAAGGVCSRRQRTDAPAAATGCTPTQLTAAAAVMSAQRASLRRRFTVCRRELLVSPCDTIGSAGQPVGSKRLSDGSATPRRGSIRLVLVPRSVSGS